MSYKLDDLQTRTQVVEEPASQTGNSTRSRQADAEPSVIGTKPASNKGSDSPLDDESRYVTGARLVLICCAFATSVFLISIDQAILATALPKIVSEWEVLPQISWIATAYFLTQAGCLLTAGQFLTIAPSKWIYLGSIAVFELGSLMCGAAPNIEFLIFSRAVAGVGGAAIFVSIIVIIAEITRLEQRPVLIGAIGSVFALASIVGPLLGGAFTDHVTWRLCFYINLPFGVLSIGGVIFTLPARPPLPLPAYEGKTVMQKWLMVDWIGSIFCLGWVTCLLLPLQWGGNEKPWNDPVVIALFCVFGVLLGLFVGWEYRTGLRAIMPLYMFKRRSLVGTAMCSFFVFLSMLMATYYLPFYYQAKGRTATQAGIDMLPFMISTVVIIALTGGIVRRTGRYWHFLFVSPMLISVACGLLYTTTSTTHRGTLIGYQILLGIGVGGALQNTVIAIQSEYANEEALVPQATAIVTFIRLIGGTIGLSIAGAIFANQLRKQLDIYVPGLDPALASLVRQSVTAIFQLPEEYQSGVIRAYLRAVSYVFILGIPSGALASFSALMINNHNIKTRAKEPVEEPEGPATSPKSA